MKTVKRFKVLIFALVMLILILPFGGAGALGPFTDSWAEPVDVTVYNPCNNEWVWLTGTMHILYHDNVTPSGQLHWETRISYHNVRGTGLTSGNNYVGVGVDQGGGSTIFLPETSTLPYHYEATSQNSMSLIGKGRNQNFTVHMNFHLTVTPGFEAQGFHENFRFECR